MRELRMKLSSLIDLEELELEISNGMVTRRFHGARPCAILNYTLQCQYTWHWTDLTVKCRGLVYNTETLEVVARPFEKFFNWDQGRGSELWHNPMPPTGPVVRMEKMDGSLGILCFDENSVSNGVPTDEWIATRGSFHSEQAEWATEFYVNTCLDMVGGDYFATAF